MSEQDGNKETTVYRGREIASLIQDLSEYEQFEVMPKYDDLEEHDKGPESSLRIHQTLGVIVPGNKVDKHNLDEECILNAFDKAGLSMVLDLPIPPGATFEARLTTWLNPCHGKFNIEPTLHFGVGVVPVGTAKEESWVRDDFCSGIENGVQFYTESKMSSMMGGGGGGDMNQMLRAMLAGNHGSMTESTVTVYENGSTKHHSEGKLSLGSIHVTVNRELSGDSKIQIKQAHHKYTIRYKKEKEDPEDLQLYVNALNWPDNMIYVRFDDLKLTQPVDGDKKTKAEDKGEETRVAKAQKIE